MGLSLSSSPTRVGRLIVPAPLTPLTQLLEHPNYLKPSQFWLKGKAKTLDKQPLTYMRSNEVHDSMILFFMPVYASAHELKLDAYY